MSNWRQWWRLWLATSVPARRADADVDGEQDVADQALSPGHAAAVFRHPAAAHPANATYMAGAARRMQEQLGNHGVQLLAQQEGAPLSSALRAPLASELGDDLADVRLHTGAAGAAIARAADANANAVTVGKDIAFATGAYAPETAHGRTLLAHELAHTVQAGPGAGAGRAQLEREAAMGRPTPNSAGLGQALRDEKKSWSERVKAAQAEADAGAQRTALIALITEALTGYSLNIVAATPNSGPVKTAQYKPAPAINFDYYLEQKEYWPGAGRKGKLGPRTGYFFSDGGTAYAILGPGALEAATPILTKMYADHELFHGAHHVGAGGHDDQELEAWTDNFVNYFHQVYQARKSWAPMIQYYEDAGADARKAALKALVDYFKGQPEEIQATMLHWLKRRQDDMADKQLVKDLVAALPKEVTPAKKPVQAPPPPKP